MNLYTLLAAVVGGEIVDLVGETGPVAKSVLLLLLIFSLISWAIILSKWSVLRRARVQTLVDRIFHAVSACFARFCRKCPGQEAAGALAV